ncbi:MAG TPA: ATPase domain-containing protein [Gammaproteobacteria bacterium]
MAANDSDLVSSGIAGLDEILRGGFRRNQLYLVEGGSGAGKTTLALQFLLAGVRAGERALFLGFSESPRDLERIARSHGWSLDGVAARRIGASGQGETRYTLFPASEVELQALLEEITQAVEAERPQRLVMDPVSALRWFTADYFEYRRCLETLRRTLAERSCTTLLLDDESSTEPQFRVRGLADGVLVLRAETDEWGFARRRIAIEKARGIAVAGGLHDCRLATGGLVVFPRADCWAAAAPERLPDDAPLLVDTADFGAALGGGLPWGSSVLLAGPSGSGKSRVAMTWSRGVLARGRSVLYLSLDEPLADERGDPDGLAEAAAAQGANGASLLLERIDCTVSAGELASRVRAAAEAHGAPLGMVVLDGLAGYRRLAGSTTGMESHLRRLIRFLEPRGIIALALLTERGVLGPIESDIDVSFLFDVVLLTRFFRGERGLHRSIAVVKHRRFNHERTVRELLISEEGVALSAPLQGGVC